MKPITAADPEARSADVVADNIARLRALFPEAFTEGKIDFDVLKQLLGGAVEEQEEKYGLNWHGKRRARQIALTPSTGTLRPCREESVDWDTTQNLMIEGDNLEVLKLLQKSYAGKVKLIYIDPPYNTGKDFVYPDDFRDSIRNYLQMTGQVDGNSHKITSNPETSGRFHTDWANMMYPRLKLARNLLAPDGILIVSIDDQESQRLRLLLDEIIGEENFLAQIIWKKVYGGGAKVKHVVGLHESALCYARDKSAISFISLPADPAIQRLYKWRDSKYETRGPYYTQPLATTSMDERENLRYPISYNGEEIWPEKQWQWKQERTLLALQNDELVIKKTNDGWSVRYKQYQRDEEGVERGAKPFSILDGPYTQEGTKEVQELFGDNKIFPFPKPVKLIKHFLDYVWQDSQALILDFFAGSGTTAHAVMAQNAADGGARRYVLVQLPESLDPAKTEHKAASDFCDRIGKRRNVAELTKERIRRAAKTIRNQTPSFNGDLGFRVFKLDSSNIQTWDADRQHLDQSLFDAAEHLKADRSEDDIRYELLLKLGLDLCVPTETETISGKTVHSIGGGALLVCLDKEISRKDTEPLALGIVKWHKALASAGESQVVFRDAAFVDDVAKTNLTAILTQHGLANVRSL